MPSACRSDSTLCRVFDDRTDPFNVFANLFLDGRCSINDNIQHFAASFFRGYIVIRGPSLQLIRCRYRFVIAFDSHVSNVASEFASAFGREQERDPRTDAAADQKVHDLSAEPPEEPPALVTG